MIIDLKLGKYWTIKYDNEQNIYIVESTGFPEGLYKTKQKQRANKYFEEQEKLLRFYKK